MKFKYHIRLAINKLLHLQKLGNIGLPSRVLPELEAYSECILIRKPYCFKCSPPRVDNEVIKSDFNAHRQFDLPVFKLAHLKKPYLCSHGMYVMPNDRSGVFKESVRHEPKFNMACAQNALKRYPIQKMAGRYFLGFDKWGYDYYYHWMVESLSRFLAIDRLPEDVKIILPRKTQPYMLRSLELFGGIDPSRYIYFDDSCWELEECYFPTKPYGWFLPSQREAVEVSNRILANYDPDGAKSPGSKLYVSRGKCRNRKLLNEDAVKQYLEDRGFVTYYPEEHTLDEQIVAFREAKAIVASFGSAMTNLMFCRPGTEVTILYDVTYFDTCIWVLGECFELQMDGIGYSPSEGVQIQSLSSIK